MENTVYSDSSTKAAQQRVSRTLATSLKKKYGIDDIETTRKFLRIHGLDETSFDVIANSERNLTSGLTDNSFDQNSNKAGSTISGLINESATVPYAKILGYRELYRQMKTLFGKADAKRLSGEMYDLSIALNDSGQILKNYSYYGNTPILVKINDAAKITTFKKLFKEFKNSSIDEDDAQMIYTDNLKKDLAFKPSFIKQAVGVSKNANGSGLYENIRKNYEIKVWDTTNGWVDISRILRHKTDKDMIAYQIEDGDFALVTEDHPVIMKNGEDVLSADLKVGDEVLKEDILPQNIKREIYDVPDNIAYLLGFILGDGNIQGYELSSAVDNGEAIIKFERGGSLFSIYQKDIEECYEYTIAKKALPNANWFTANVGMKDMVRSCSSYEMAYISSVFCEDEYKSNSFTKTLPSNIFDWEIHSIEALLAGLIDADGTVQDSGRVSVRMMSYGVISGLYDLLRVIPSINYESIKKSLGGVSQENLIYQIMFRLNDENNNIFEFSKKIKTAALSNEDFFKYDNKFSRFKKTSKITKIFRFNKNEVKETRFFRDELEYVYDITTETGRFYANGMVQHNCYSYDFSKLVKEGRPWGQLHSKPPKRVSSYITSLTETVHQLASQTAGACAVGSFFLDIAHIIIYFEKVSLNKVKKDKKYRKYIENCIQTFVHSVNHLSRNSIESPFTNISIMDRPKIEGLIADTNMGWYFPKMKKDYVAQMIEQIQDIFMNFFEKGDPCADGRPYRFPVTTLNVTKDEKGEVADKKFLDKICKKDIYRYNIMVSKGSKFSNCCFTGDQAFTYINADGEKVLTNFKDFVYDRLPEALRTDHGKQVQEVKGEYIEGPNGEKVDILAVAKLNNTYDNIVVLEKEDGTILKGTPDQKIWDNNTNALVAFEDILKSPKDYDINSKVLKATSYKTNEEVYDIEVNSPDHTFILEGSRVSNCRLISDSDMFDMGGSVSSLGMSNISLGSHRVAAINFNRIALEANSIEEYYGLIKERAEDAAKILKAHKELLADLEKRGFQEFITNGYIKFNRLFSTFGIAGILEAQKTLGRKFGAGDDIIENTLILLNDYAKEFGEKYKINVNIEQIPGESTAVRLRDADAMIYGEEVSDTPLYSNQMVSLWEDHPVWERMDNDGKLNKLYTGGSITHFTIGERVTSSQARDLINYAVKSGCEHFALNAIYSECEDEHNTMGNHDTCPKCGKPIIAHYTRVVGFFTKVEDWNKTRREFDFKNRKAVKL